MAVGLDKKITTIQRKRTWFWEINHQANEDIFLVKKLIAHW